MYLGSLNRAPNDAERNWSLEQLLCLIAVVFLVWIVRSPIVRDSMNYTFDLKVLKNPT